MFDKKDKNDEKLFSDKENKNNGKNRTSKIKL